MPWYIFKNFGCKYVKNPENKKQAFEIEVAKSAMAPVCPHCKVKMKDNPTKASTTQTELATKPTVQEPEFDYNAAVANVTLAFKTQNISQTLQKFCVEVRTVRLTCLGFRANLSLKCI